MWTFVLFLSTCLTTLILGDDHVRLTVLGREFFNWRLEDRPEFATNIGYYRHSDRMENYDLKLMKGRVEKAKEYYQTLRSIDINNLSKKDQVDYTILNDMLQSYIEGYKWRNWNYLNPVNWLEGYQRNPFFFVEFTSFENRGDFENYIARLHEIPRVFDEYMKLFDEAIRTGRTSHNVSVERVPAQIASILASQVNGSIYFSPFIDYLEEFNKTMPKKVRDDLIHRGRLAVQAVHDAYKKLKDYIENVYMKHTRPYWGVGSLANGRNYYKACLHWYLSLNMTPEEIHELGLKEVDRIKALMQTIMDKQGYGGSNIRDYFTHLKERDDMIYNTEEEVLAEYENIISNRIEPILNGLFKDHPGLPIKVESMSWDGSRGQYLSGTSDGTRPGIFYVNTFKRAQKSAAADPEPKLKYPKYTMISLAMHEANPGHHLQISYAVTADLPIFRKNKEHSEKFRVPYAFPSYTAFMEGWALYAEYLGMEKNLYEKDYELMGYYESEIFRAARLVVDTGLHYFNWSKDEAVEYFMNYTAESREGILVEVDRYITWPGQAVTYKIGELKFRALREYAEKELGDRFDVREFHTAVLKNGAVPLHTLEDQVVEWVKHHPHKAHDLGGSEDCDCTTPDPAVKSRCQRSVPRENGFGLASGPGPVLTILLFLCILALND